MQVKKFEARTMKEALEMVKAQLGPEAIILSARDNHRSFGLVGEGSVEITAAISEESLQKRRFAQSKLRDEDRQRFEKSSARAQRALIEQVVQNHTQKQKVRPITTRRYIDIDEEENSTPVTAATVTAPVNKESTARLRIKDAAQRAWQAMNFGQPNSPEIIADAASGVVAEASSNQEILSLKNEISSLKKMLNQFQTIPQSFTGQFPGAPFGLSYEVSFLFEKLKNEGLEETEIVEFLMSIQESVPVQHQKNKSLVEGVAVRRMMEKIAVCDPKSDSKFHFFFGPSGAGKTSVLVKMASHKVVNDNKKVALITTDTYKVGAADQLRIFAQILNIPFAIIKQPEDWVKLRKHFDHMDHIFVDFPGFSLRKLEENEILTSLVPASLTGVSHHLVLSALGKFEDLNEMVNRYKSFHIDDLIFNSIDQCVQFGNVYSLMARQQLPLHSFGLGPRLPEDFEYATKERLLDLIFKITLNNEANRTRTAVGESR